MRNRRCIGIKVQNIFHVEETRLLLLFLNARKTGFHAQKLEMQVNKFVQHFHYKVLLQPQSAEWKQAVGVSDVMNYALA